MNSVCKPSLRWLAVAALAAGGPAIAGTVGGTVSAVNTLTDNYYTNIVIVPSVGQTDTQIVSGTIDNNSDTGWKLTVESAREGKLTHEDSPGGGDGREILYTSIKFVRTGGTLGAGLSDPHNTTRNIATGALGGGVAGTTNFNTGALFGSPGTATSATVGYAFSLRISWSADTSLLSGFYSDTITLTLANDS